MIRERGKTVESSVQDIPHCSHDGALRRSPPCPPRALRVFPDCSVGTIIFGQIRKNTNKYRRWPAEWGEIVGPASDVANGRHSPSTTNEDAIPVSNQQGLASGSRPRAHERIYAARRSPAAARQHDLRGDTDIPCMRLVRDQSGHSVAVQQPGCKTKMARAEMLMRAETILTCLGGDRRRVPLKAPTTESKVVKEWRGCDTGR